MIQRVREIGYSQIDVGVLIKCVGGLTCERAPGPICQYLAGERACLQMRPLIRVALNGIRSVSAANCVLIGLVLFIQCGAVL